MSLLRRHHHNAEPHLVAPSNLGSRHAALQPWTAWEARFPSRLRPAYRNELEWMKEAGAIWAGAPAKCRVGTGFRSGHGEEDDLARGAADRRCRRLPDDDSPPRRSPGPPGSAGSTSRRPGPPSSPRGGRCCPLDARPRPSSSTDQLPTHAEPQGPAAVRRPHRHRRLLRRRARGARRRLAARARRRRGRRGGRHPRRRRASRAARRILRLRSPARPSSRMPRRSRSA